MRNGASDMVKMVEIRKEIGRFIESIPCLAGEHFILSLHISNG
jgi:hypothetical protein